MSREAEENPPYITYSHILGKWQVIKMTWDDRAEGYQVSISSEVHNKAEAMIAAIDWSRREGLEYRQCGQ